MTITIFSTKAFGANELFDIKACTPVEGDAKRIIEEYFLSPNIVSFLREQHNEESRNKLQDIISDTVRKYSAEPETYNITDNSRSIIEKELDSSFEQKLKNRFKRYAECETMIRDTIIALYEILPLKDIITSIGGRNLYALNNTSGIYGIKCLDRADNEKKWITCLVRCALALASDESAIDIQLVLHDKDVKGFEKQDVTILLGDDAKSEVLDNSHNSIFSRINSLSIVFFQHTTNRFAQIVGHEQNDNEDIQKCIRNAIIQYQEIPQKERFPYL